MQQIVVGVDASDASLEAARFAGRLAEQTGAELTVVHVRATPFPGAEQDLDVGELETYWQAAEQRAAQQTSHALAGCTSAPTSTLGRWGRCLCSWCSAGRTP